MIITCKVTCEGNGDIDCGVNTMYEASAEKYIKPDCCEKCGGTVKLSCVSVVKR